MKKPHNTIKRKSITALVILAIVGTVIGLGNVSICSATPEKSTATTQNSLPQTHPLVTLDFNLFSWLKWPEIKIPEIKWPTFTWPWSTSTSSTSKTQTPIKIPDPIKIQSPIKIQDPIQIQPPIRIQDPIKIQQPPKIITPPPIRIYTPPSSSIKRYP
jgi:hypothetical protein